MRLLYGVAGEGMGHATRSRVVVEHLLARGHDVLVASSGGALRLLAGVAPRAVAVGGLTLRCDAGAVDVAGSLRGNLARLAEMAAGAAACFAAADAFAPHAVVTDFEPVAHAYGMARGLPVVSVDNIQMLARCRHDVAWLRIDPATFARAAEFAAARLPRCARYVVTTFFYPPLRPEAAADTALVPPLLRAEVRAARPRDAGHVLVYQTASSAALPLAALGACPERRFLVYGAPPGAALPPNCAARPFDQRAFVDDLAGAHAVVANGGMSLLAEAISLGKPVLAVPLGRHPEQQMNAAYLARLGYGASTPRLDAAIVRDFLAAAPRFAAALRAAPTPRDNAVALAAVDAALAAVVPSPGR